MDSKVGFFLVASVALLPAFANSQKSPSHYNPRQNLYNYALSTCLADGYELVEMKRSFAAAARAYLEHGDLPLEAHTEATQLARTFLARKYESITSDNLTLMKCIDLFHSRELQLIAKKYGKTK